MLYVALNEIGLITRILCEVNAFINTLASLLLVYLVYFMVRSKVCKYTDFLFMVVLMSSFQAVYDFSSIFQYVCVDIGLDEGSQNACYSTSIAVNLCSGVASSAWAFIICLVVLYVAWTQRRLRKRTLRVANVIVTISSLLIGWAGGYYSSENYNAGGGKDTAQHKLYADALLTYSGTRLCLILASFVVLALILLKLYWQRAKTAASSSSNNNNNNNNNSGTTTRAEHTLQINKRGALEVLVTRLVYYPVVYMIAR